MKTSKTKKKRGSNNRITTSTRKKRLDRAIRTLENIAELTEKISNPSIITNSIGTACRRCLAKVKDKD